MFCFFCLVPFFLIPTLLSCALSVSGFHLLLPSCCLCFALLCSALFIDVLFYSLSIPIILFRPATPPCPFVFSPPSPRIRCWSLSTCSYSPTQTLPTFSHRSFLWVFLSGGAGMDAFLFPLSISVPHTRLRLFREPLHPPMYMSMNMSLNMSLLLFPMPLSPCY